MFVLVVNGVDFFGEKWVQKSHHWRLKEARSRCKDAKVWSDGGQVVCHISLRYSPRANRHWQNIQEWLR